ncbi:protein Skeletor, isoforms B/C isoform X1 [Vespa velutina]|uniref:protein Skeletor, isoforms B/C isoform X1 n=1 Tax=Vespa velutina TaxID=202808 RepID=UPI001FB4A58E|nr:protein Skeletor, isoforms B/C isoform X1 [Vespa velutina]XP_047371595.1 protein Skeletor, isoforms B/C isoform X1 [Vespa velutina]XP_047371596.1 protein Skeletor, isoforms B/C isoform X1 [Vespa velutina]
MTTRSPTTSPSDRRSTIGLVLAIFFIFLAQLCDGAYYGKLIGKLSELHHGVSGEVYAVDGRTLFIKDFTYDGEGPAAFFYAGNTKSPNSNGFRVRDERGTASVLKRYRRKDITLTLPDGKTLNSIKWFSVWCDEFAVNFGDVRIPRGFDYPKPQKLAALNGVHGVSSEPIVIVDAQTLLIPGFSYDGEAPDAKFWVGAGPSPSPQGIRVPDENGKEQPLRRYDRKTIVLTLPGDLTVHQIGHFGVWCEAFTVDFGHIQIPQGLNVPPSLKMLGVSPQSKLNCEVLDDTLAFELRWAVAGDSIVVQLVGKLDAGQYMAFGLSANPERSVMIGGDVVVAWVDKQTLQGYAIDYFLDAKSQCSGGRGSCPDTKIQEDTNSVRLLNAALVNGYSIVTYQRPLKASDELDRQVLTNRSQAIIWAVGPLNERQEVSFHSDYLKTDRFIEFGRPPAWNCPIPDQEQPDTYIDNDNNANSNQQLAVTTRRPQRVPATPAPAPTNDAWEIPPIQCYEPEDGVFYAQMGPTGGKHGYPAITGHVGWGISWYINGLLIPEINVVRGKKYTFVVEGGQNADTPARYHPFYITDDPVGGYQHKTPEEKAKIKIFAGVRRQRGSIRPTGVGRFCYWVPDQKQPPADEFTSFGAYQRTLTLECDHGEPGIVEWTPDENTPDTVYYQCFTHRYLGWKINVHDNCDEGSASENHEVYVEQNGHPELIEDLDVSPSIRVSSKVTPTAEFLQQHLHHPHHREHGLRYPHHTATNSGKLSTSYAQLLTNANHNNYERFRTSAIHEDAYGPRSNHGIIPHRYEVRVKENYRHAHLDEEALQRQQQQQKQQQTASSIYSELGGIGTINRPTSISSTSATITSTALSSYPSRPQFTEIDQEIRQSSNHQLSNLVADNSRPLSHGMKFAYTLPTTQIVYSRPTSHHYAPDHHHLHHLLHYHQHQPEQQRAQVMIVRRPVLMRRPILQSSHTINSPTFALPPSRSIFMERKKAVYKVPTSEKVSYGNIVKLMKLDPKQRTKLEAKVSEAAVMDISGNLMTSLKPARNTGFNPDSIVIEGGFKPIIDPSRDLLEKRISDSDQEYEETIKESTFSDQLSSDNFEPVFLPSPSMNPASDKSKKQKKKPNPTNVNHSSKPALDELDDMQMAADGLQSYYLPPARSEAESATAGVLITYDGKKVKDSSLARSISEIEDRSKTRLTSDVLSRTPQFGRFKGELPPLIPAEIRSSDKTTRLERNEQSASLDLPLLKSRKNTRLTLVERSKRSPEETRTMSSMEFRRSNITKNTSNEEDVDDMTTLGSTGQTILANIKYVVLTIILYYVI